MAIEKGLGSDEKSSIFDLNATPTVESQLPLKQKSMHYLSLVKPHMVQRVLTFRGFCEKREAVSMSSHSHMNHCGEGQSVEQFPLHPPIATTKAINSRESAHQLQGLRSEVEGPQPPASRSPPPATNPQKQSLTQLSIFYKGTVNTYDVPADKALTFSSSPHTIISLVFRSYYFPNPMKFSFATFVFPSIKFWVHLDGQAEAIMNILAGSGSSHELDCDSDMEEREAYTGTSRSSGSPPIWKAASADDQNETFVVLPVPTERATGGGIQQIDKLRGANLPLAIKQSLQRFSERRQIRHS